MLKNIEGLLIDLDGTIFKGEQLIPKAEEAITYFRSLNKKVVYLSNRGNISRKMCLHKLLQHGIKTVEQDIILSSTVTALFIKKHYPFGSVWILGNDGLKEEMKTYDVELANIPEEADFLVITLHDDIHYSELNLAFKAAKHGARIIATNSDKMYPNENGSAIDVAGMIGAIEATTGRKTELVIGKPSCFMMEAALEQLMLPANKCMIIGDSLESDIAMGKLQGMKTTLVLSGNTSTDMIDSVHKKRRPDYIVESIFDVR
ncbi:HAD-IIA family hydrolase [Evansella sp. AB-P1]|uniref:HAD-IIA family hydrolase n=1 Tax=Evansella sp. AB-P1 TaxID=3037653 RepID=UPI00241FA104|nr:HAD-IIA family hydrolase [Evansella sp. AB-P1]MDG5787844.1 HAD-IIA family hydrolase [Evansella sp. AB-P1]